MYTLMHVLVHTDMHSDACLSTYKPIYMHTTYMYTYIHNVHTHMETHTCLIETISQVLMFACPWTYIPMYMHAYISHYNLRTTYFNDFEICIIFRISKLPKIQRSGNMVISTFLVDYCLLLFSVLSKFI